MGKIYLWQQNSRYATGHIYLPRTVSLIDRASILSSLDIHSLKQRMGEEFQDVLFYNKSFLSDISCDISKMSCLGAEIVFYVFSFFELFCLSSDRETAGAELGNMIWCGLAARTLEKLIIYYASPSLLRFLPTFRPIINWGLSANYEEAVSEHVWCAVQF